MIHLANDARTRTLSPTSPSPPSLQSPRHPGSDKRCAQRVFYNRAASKSNRFYHDSHSPGGAVDKLKVSVRRYLILFSPLSLIDATADD